MLSAPPRQAADAEKNPFEDALDRHVDDVLQRPSKWRRTLMGVWSFLKTRTFKPISRVDIHFDSQTAMGVRLVPI